MLRSPFALTAVGLLATVLIGVLTVVIDEFSLAPWQRALVMGSTVPVSIGLVWAGAVLPRTRALGRWFAATVALRGVESAFAYWNPARYPERVVGYGGTAALVVRVDGRVSMDVRLGVYDADHCKVGVVQVYQIRRGEAVCPVVLRDGTDVWIELEERLARDDSVPPGLHVRLEDAEVARMTTLEVLREWRAR